MRDILIAAEGGGGSAVGGGGCGGGGAETAPITYICTIFGVGY